MSTPPPAYRSDPRSVGQRATTYSQSPQPKLEFKLHASAATPPPISKQLQQARRVPHVLAPLAHTDKQQRAAQRHQGLQGSMHAAPSPQEAAATQNVESEVRVAHRIHNAVEQTRKRLHHTVQASSTHSPASFMAEITSHVEAQLQQLEREFPVDARHSRPQQTLLQSDLEHRVVGAAVLTPEERRRKARVDVFVGAQRLFADCFQSYKLFLNAMTDEHVTYNRFLEEDLTRHREVIVGMRQRMHDLEAGTAAQVEQLRRENEEQRAAFDVERAKLERQRQQLIDASKDRNKDGDARRQLQEQETKLRSATDELNKLRVEVESLRRQNEQLWIGTFSDALDTANQQLAEWKMQCGRKDEALIEAHDDLAAITRDIKKIVAHFNTRVETPLQHCDVRLGEPTLRLLFPEEAKRLTRGGTVSLATDSAPPAASVTMDVAPASFTDASLLKSDGALGDKLAEIAEMAASARAINGIG